MAFVRSAGVKVAFVRSAGVKVAFAPSGGAKATFSSWAAALAADAVTRAASHCAEPAYASASQVRYNANSRAWSGDLAELRGVRTTARQFQHWVPNEYSALRYETIVPPIGVVAGVLEYCVELRLSHGAFDFVITPDGSGVREVRQVGPHRLWRSFEDAYREWDSLGRPGWDRLGLTVLPDGSHDVWLDSPMGEHRWAMVAGGGLTPGDSVSRR